MSPLRFTLIQTNLHWENKSANLKMLEEKMLHVQEPSQVVILPEMFNTGFSMKPKLLAETMEGETVTWMRNMASLKKIILTGSVIIDEAGKYYNRLIWMLPNGQYGYYDKRHLFAYGEEDKHFTAGNKRFIASVNGWKINLLICYDLRFPVWSRQQFDEANKFEYDVLIYVANWPEKRNLAWKTLLHARAIENQCYVIGVNRTGTDGNGIYYNGNSMVIDPLGKILYEKAGDENINSILLNIDELENVRSQFPFCNDADRFTIS